MDSQDLVALIALIVSLVALLIALLQLLQSSALTAEGWRQCNATNMGPWSVFSRRKWLWSELRCEVKFTTPVLSLMDTNTLCYGIGPESSMFVTAQKGKLIPKPRPGRLIFDEESRFSRPETSLARVATHILGFGTLPNMIEHGWTSVGDSIDRNGRLNHISFGRYLFSLLKPSDFMQSCIRWFRGYHFRHWPQHLSPYEKDRNAITWDNMLREVYKRQYATMSNRPQHSMENDIFNPGMRETESLSIPIDSGITKKNMKDQLRQDETVVCVDLQRNSWDFIPPDVVRPLASSTLSTVIIIARRLGMEWKTFDMSTELFRAEGNGCTLSATRVRGLGLVFRFDKSRRTLEGEYPLCTENADMAYFGIVPGEGRLGVPDFSLVDDKGNLELNTFIEAELGEKSKELRDKLWFWGRIIPNDAAALLCPFMPLRRSPVPMVYTAMGTRNLLDISAKVSIFRAFGLDPALRKQLNGRIQAVLSRRFRGSSGPRYRFSQANESSSKESRMPERLQFFDIDLRDKFIDTALPSLFANHRELKTRISKVKDGRHIVSYLASMNKASALAEVHVSSHNAPRDPTWRTDHLREIHDITTEYFECYMTKGGIDNLEDSTSTVVEFAHLVRAYMTLVSQCLLEWYKTSDKRGKQGKATNHADGDLSDGWQNLLHFCNMLLLPESIARFRRYSRDNLPKDTSITDEELDDLFWMIMARGAAWQLSVNVARTDAKTLVPSSIYGSKMPVWIE